MRRAAVGTADHRTLITAHQIDKQILRGAAAMVVGNGYSDGEILRSAIGQMHISRIAWVEVPGAVGVQAEARHLGNGAENQGVAAVDIRADKMPADDRTTFLHRARRGHAKHRQVVTAGQRNYQVLHGRSAAGIGHFHWNIEFLLSALGQVLPRGIDGSKL